MQCYLGSCADGFLCKPSDSVVGWGPPSREGKTIPRISAHFPEYELLALPGEKGCCSRFAIKWLLGLLKEWCHIGWKNNAILDNQCLSLRLDAGYSVLVVARSALITWSPCRWPTGSLHLYYHGLWTYALYVSTLVKSTFIITIIYV